MGVFATNKAVDRLEDRCKALEIRCEDLERARKSLDLEFTELYDKVRHQMSRMAKRTAADANSKPILNGPEPDNSTSLSTDPVSASIMLRRSMGAHGR